MRYGRYGWPHLFVSWGLGATFLWVGLDIFTHPDIWMAYLPDVIPGDISQGSALNIIGAINLACGIALVLRLWQKLAALIVAVQLFGLLVQHGISDATIGYVGLLGADLSLLRWPIRYRKKGIFSKLFGRKSSNKKKKRKHDDEEED